jgi:hypothetical protein
VKIKICLFTGLALKIKNFNDKAMEVLLKAIDLDA